MRIALLFALLGLTAGCCGSPDDVEFPEVSYASSAEAVAVVRSRTAVRSLYAVISMAFDGPAHSGTFDVVVNYQAPRKLRMTAFKDLIVSTHDIFDLLLTPQGYTAEHRPQEQGDPVVQKGPLAKLPQDLPRFAGFYLCAEGLFLPGSLADPSQAKLEGAVLEGTLASGQSVRWGLDPRTLKVVSGRVATDGGAIDLRYDRYRKVQGFYLPWRVRYHEARTKTRIEVRVKELEVNPRLAADVFVFER